MEFPHYRKRHVFVIARVCEQKAFSKAYSEVAWSLAVLIGNARGGQIDVRITTAENNRPSR